MKNRWIQVENAMNACIENAAQAVKKIKDELPLVNVDLHQRIADLLSSAKFKANSFVKEG